MAASGTPFDKAAPAYQRPCLRADLKQVYENPETGKGPVRLVDPKTGRQYTFDEADHALCRRADGTLDLTEIHAAQGTGHPARTPAQVVDLFRRLHVLGLLEPPGTQTSRATTATAAARAAGLRNRRPGAGPATGAGQPAGAVRAGPAARRDGQDHEAIADRIRARGRAGKEAAKQDPPPADPGQSAASRADALRRKPAPPATPAASQAGAEAPDDPPPSPPKQSTPDVTPAAPQGPAAPVAPPGDAHTRDAPPNAPRGPRLGPGTGPGNGRGTGPGAGFGRGGMAPGGGAGRRRGALGPDGEARPGGDSPATLTAAAARVRERARKAPPEPPAAGPASAGPATEAPASPPAGQTPGTGAPDPKGAAPVPAPPTPDPAPDPPRPPVRRGLGAVLQRKSRRDETPQPADPAPKTPAPVATSPDSAPEATPPAPGPTPQTEPGTPAFNFFDDSFDDDDGMGDGMMGGMRGGMGGGGMAGMMGGGMRGGGMGGGMGGGGMAGMMGGGMMGGMRGGMGGGGMAGMMGGGMMGGMGGGGMGGGIGGGTQATTGPKLPAQWKLFDPQGFFRLLYILFYPLKYVLWALLPLVTIAGLSMLNNFDALISDLFAMAADIGSVAQIAIGIFTANLASRLAQGVAIVAYGGRVPSFGVALVLGVMPRFYVDKNAIAGLDRSGQLWGHGSPLLARLATFAIGILVWAITREQGGALSQIALVSAQFGLLMFVATSWPLMLSDGMRWLSTYLNEPRLVPKAIMAFKYAFLGADLPPMMSRRDAMPLVLFSVGAILSMLLMLSVIGLTALIFLEASLNGLGVMIFLGMVTAFTIWIVSVWRTIMSQGTGGFDKEAFKRFTQGGKPTADAMPDLDGTDDAALPSKAKVVWGVILAILLVLAFQPYKYDAGGQVTILPVSKAQAIARAEGEIIEVLVAEGDMVVRDQVLARLSSWDQERQVAVTQTDLTSAEASLARLREGASSEEIEVARRQVASAEASVAFSQAEYDRARQLAETGTGTQAAMEKALSTLESDLAGLEVSRASLELVLAEASANEVAIAQSDVDRLRLELQYQRDELERTRVVAPMDGRIVTANLQLLIGKYLRSGDPLLEIENARIVTAEIAVPESDIALISPGDEVRLRAAGHADVEIVGQVQTIAPSAEDEGYGSVVRVAAIFENETDFLRSGMTGYAKIDGAEMRAWEAYLRSIRRFFQIEVWSWIP